MTGLELLGCATMLGPRRARNRALGADRTWIGRKKQRLCPHRQRQRRRQQSVKRARALRLYSIFVDTTPKDGVDPDKRSVERGAQIVALSDGWIDGDQELQVCRGGGCDARNAVVRQGRRPCSGRFRGYETLGRLGQSVKLDQPVEALGRRKTYVASYFAPKGS